MMKNSFAILACFRREYPGSAKKCRVATLAAGIFDATMIRTAPASTTPSWSGWRTNGLEQAFDTDRGAAFFP
jgi:hypothetical protein